jgi:hypothetical protein
MSLRSENVRTRKISKINQILTKCAIYAVCKKERGSGGDIQFCRAVSIWRPPWLVIRLHLGGKCCCSATLVLAARFSSNDFCWSERRYEFVKWLFEWPANDFKCDLWCQRASVVLMESLWNNTSRSTWSKTRKFTPSRPPSRPPAVARLPRLTSFRSKTHVKIAGSYILMLFSTHRDAITQKWLIRTALTYEKGEKVVSIEYFPQGWRPPFLGWLIGNDGHGIK